MNHLPTAPRADYSPDISIELLVHGERFNVASLGPRNLALRDARPMAPGVGIVRLVVDGQVTVIHVDLRTGIDPSRPTQPYVQTTVQEAVA
jgi:hypothetical protein